MTYNLLLFNTRLKTTFSSFVIYPLFFPDLVPISRKRKLPFLRRAQLSWSHTVLGKNLTSAVIKLFRIYESRFPCKHIIELVFTALTELDWKLKIHSIVQFKEAMFQLLGKGSKSTQFSKHKNTKMTKPCQIPSTLQHRVLWQLKNKVVLDEKLGCKPETPCCP